MEVSDAKRLKELETENNRLWKLLAEADFDKAMLKYLLGKNGEAGRMEAPPELYPRSLFCGSGNNFWAHFFCRHPNHDGVVAAVAC